MRNVDIVITIDAFSMQMLVRCDIFCINKLSDEICLDVHEMMALIN